MSDALDEETTARVIGFLLGYDEGGSSPVFDVATAMVANAVHMIHTIPEDDLPELTDDEVREILSRHPYSAADRGGSDE